MRINLKNRELGQDIQAIDFYFIWEKFGDKNYLIS